MEDTGWGASDIRFGCLSRQVDPQDTDIVRYIIPITAFDIDPGVGVDLLTHELDATVIVNIGVIQEMFARAGFETEIGPEGEMSVGRLSDSK